MEGKYDIKFTGPEEKRTRTINRESLRVDKDGQNPDLYSYRPIPGINASVSNNQYCSSHPYTSYYKEERKDYISIKSRDSPFEKKTFFGTHNFKAEKYQSPAETATVRKTSDDVKYKGMDKKPLKTEESSYTHYYHLRSFEDNKVKLNGNKREHDAAEDVADKNDLEETDDGTDDESYENTDDDTDDESYENDDDKDESDHSNYKQDLSSKRMYWCSICWLDFRHIIHVKRHMKRRHFEHKVPPYRCVPCKVNFYRGKLLTQHLNKCQFAYLQKKIYKCSKCNKSFPKFDSCKSHEYSAHNESQIFTCTLCNKAFRREKSLRHHLTTHLELQKRCKVCGRPFKKVNDLKRHMRTHENGVPYLCLHCKVGFTEKKDFRRHKRQSHKK